MCGLKKEGTGEEASAVCEEKKKKKGRKRRLGSCGPGLCAREKRRRKGSSGLGLAWEKEEKNERVGRAWNGEGEEMEERK